AGHDLRNPEEKQGLVAPGALGTYPTAYPTPLERLPLLSRPVCDLWIKRDDRTALPYGGNKVRKLEHILADARARGATRLGTLGDVDAARELAAQVRGGAMPEPDIVMVTLGSGGTAGGLAAGLEREGMRARVVGVCVSHPWWVLAWMARRIARGCLKRTGV